MPPGTHSLHPTREAPTRLYFELLVCQGDLDLDDVLELLAEAHGPTTAEAAGVTPEPDDDGLDDARLRRSGAADIEGWGEEHAGGLPMEAPFVPVSVRVCRSG
jgi:hypothetical protein